MDQLSLKKRVRDDSDDSGFDSPEVKRIREDLLDNFDDVEFYAASHELDTFMKSFEEEIAFGTKPATETVTETVTVVDLTSESSDSQPDLGYLLEASDDELGLPPSTSERENVVKKTELVRVASELSVGGEFWGFEGEMPSFDSFEFGAVDAGSYNNGGSEFVALDGLFDYSDLGLGSAGFTWRPETLPAK